MFCRYHSLIYIMASLAKQEILYPLPNVLVRKDNGNRNVAIRYTSRIQHQITYVIDSENRSRQK